MSSKGKRRMMGAVQDLVRGRYVHDCDIDRWVAEGMEEDDIIEALVPCGHSIGKDKDGWNEFWPEDKAVKRKSVVPEVA